MDSSQHVTVPLRYGIKKMRKRRDLDALLNHGQQKMASCGNNNNLRRQAGQGVGRVIYSQDKLLNAGSTDDQDDFHWRPKIKKGGGFCGVDGHHGNIETLRFYGIMIVVIIVIMFIMFTYWFNFHLQQQIREYREKVEEISVNGQLLPRTLQAWQETSSSLLRNQTKIQEDIQEIQGSIRYLWSNFSSYCLYQHNDDSHDHNDKKLVADFGAKIEAMFSDLDNVRDHYESINNERINLQQLIGDLKHNLTEIRKDIDQPLKFNQKVTDLRNELYVRLNTMSNKLTYINDTLNQKSILIQDELNRHKNKLDELLERDANLTFHLTSLENDWPLYREDIVSLKDKLPQLEEQVSKFNIELVNVGLALKNVCLKCQEAGEQQQKEDHLLSTTRRTTTTPTRILSSTSTKTDSTTRT